MLVFLLCLFAFLLRQDIKIFRLPMKTEVSPRFFFFAFFFVVQQTTLHPLSPFLDITALATVVVSKCRLMSFQCLLR